MVHEVEDFYGVYLLVSLNPRCKGRTYIGYTVDPNRRIKQHNTGSHAGGAWRTSGRGPWEMVLIIHGFPNNISALRFEWAWQHPDKCRRLRHVPVSKRSSESALKHRWRIACHMLNTAPWNRLALNVRWLKQDFKQEFPPNVTAPFHMPVVFGPVCSKKIPGNKSGQNNGSPGKLDKKSSPSKESLSLSMSEIETAGDDCQIPSLARKALLCAVCFQRMKPDSQQLTCFIPGCGMVSHMTCLAQRFLGNDSNHLIPVEGLCPGCGTSVLWGDLIRHYKGCYRNVAQSAVQHMQHGDLQEVSLLSSSAYFVFPVFWPASTFPARHPVQQHPCVLFFVAHWTMMEQETAESYRKTVTGQITCATDKQ